MTLTVRPNEEQFQDIKKLCKAVNLATSSKALLFAAKDYPKLKEELSNSKNKINNLEWIIRELKQSILNYNEAKNEMMDLATK
jgi:hypothetical protein